MRFKNTHLLLCALLIAACSKNDNESNESAGTVREQDKHASASVLEVERTINELEFIARGIKISYPNQPGILSGTTITQGKTSEGKTKYDILFGGTTLIDGATRSGKISVVFEDALENGNTITGKHLHVRSDDEAQLYTVNGVKFKGSLIFTDISAAKSSSSVAISHLNAQSFLLKQNGDQIRFASNRKSYWVTGNSTAAIDDDVFLIKDQAYSLTISNSGTSFIEASTLSESTLNAQCTSDLFTPKKGSLKIELLGGNTCSTNLGSGQCNDQPKVTKLP